MTKSTSSQHTIIISSLMVLMQVDSSAEFARRWFEKRPPGSAAEARAPALPFGTLKTSHKFKGCIDPSEPFQCPQSKRSVALQFTCDGHAGDCLGNLDENEETCIAVKPLAKENIENFSY
ncbi:unnamed protein product [Rotaria sp. Silwood2]|nr:unnamed protein product [Rotaria sp. Silwood2]